MTAQHYKHWSTEDIEYLRRSVNDGKNAAEIGAALGRTRDAVTNQPAYRELIRFRHKRWSAEESSYLLEALASGTSTREIAAALGRTYASVVCHANKSGVLTRRKDFVPARIGEFEILCVQLPDRHRKALVRLPCCNREKWYRLASLRHRPPVRCRACDKESRSTEQPRLAPGDRAGHYTIIQVLGQGNGGWRYSIRDTRCGHESVARDTPLQRFRGLIASCACPVRTVRDGYILWTWTLPDGKPVFVAEHRVVMEQAVGRQLYPEETVHHINGVKDDNRLGNLELWTSSHPAGQRVKDKIAWAVELLRRYPGEAAAEFARDPRIVKELLGGNQ